ncbi:hypothetical protein [Aeromicrobium fastidiosum]|uniref:Uncharacterized protein n=1 Tax=Aeromicrobium fastidiosum TaxID=52699 RepID=A0A641AND2_9ACTN|nr:hypothetical protein [Aeromicrobium fastidiosum]KAA1376434.1 hypothetical protein ESP62_013490 [Aeromicrobium fastidiosum]MBP2391651.1 hypothetical protein [Aeromicrobium fastidiosum]
MSAPSRTRRDSWWRTAPVLTIAVLALVMSTAGGAYAVAKNSIGSKQLKNNAVTTTKIKKSAVQSSDIRDGVVTGADVKDGSLTAGDFAPGQLPPVPAGSSRIFFAKVDASGLLTARSPGVVSASRAGTGTYDVQLTFDASPCGVTSSATTSNRNTGAVTVSGNQVEVVARDVTAGGAPFADAAFSLMIVC